MEKFSRVKLRFRVIVQQTNMPCRAKAARSVFLSLVFAAVFLLGLVEERFTLSITFASSDLISFRTDINADGMVNIIDVAAVAVAWNCSPEDLRWNPKCDLNDDRVVNILDVATVLKDFGKEWIHYDFDELPNWNVVSGHWSVGNGSLDGSGDFEGLIYDENASWEDFTLRANVKIAADSPRSEVAFCFNLVDSGNFYWAGLGCWGHGASISRMLNDVPEELIFNGDRADIVNDVWYNVSVACSNGTIRLYVNGSLELTVDDANFCRGSIGIRIWNSHVIADYLTISGTQASSQKHVHNVLYADGTKLRAPSGEEVLLVGTQYDYNSLNREGWFSLEDVQKMKLYGGNILELHALLFKDMMPERGIINQGWINRLDDWVAYCEREQMYCLISFQNFEYKPWGPETPYWFLAGKYSKPWDASVYNMASIDFWNVSNSLQEDNRLAFLDALKFLADRYKNNAYVLFGILNEPFCGNTLVTVKNAKDLSIAYARFVERAIDAIRSCGAEQLIFVDKPYVWFSSDYLEPVKRDDIVWEDHLYVAPDCDIATWKTLLNECIQRYVLNFEKPFYVGEYGVLPLEEYEGELSDWRTILKMQVTFLKENTISGYSWHEYPYLEGEYYDYVYNWLTQEDSDYILQTIYNVGYR
jgi:hypothetical protein